MSSPVPIRYPWAGKTDASGNATISVTLRQAQYCQVTMSGSLDTGGGNWEVRVGLIDSLLSTQGGSVNMGPIPLAPGEEVRIVITGAIPLTPVSGTFWGLQGDTLEDLGLGSSTPLISAFTPTNSQVLLAPIAIAGGTSKTFNLPANVTSIVLYVSTATAGLASLTVYDDADSYIYETINQGQSVVPTAGPVTLRYFVPVDPAKTSVIRIAQGVAGNSTTVAVYGIGQVQSFVQLFPNPPPRPPDFTQSVTVAAGGQPSITCAGNLGRWMICSALWTCGSVPAGGAAAVNAQIVSDGTTYNVGILQSPAGGKDSVSLGPGSFIGNFARDVTLKTGVAFNANTLGGIFVSYWFIQQGITALSA